jgi:predicted nucleic acid-binding protein
MTGRARVFVDTNVLVYRHDSTEPAKQEQATAWIGKLWETHSGRISVQVLQEFYATVTHKLRPGLDREMARELLEPYQAWQPLAMSSSLLRDAWRVEDLYSLSWWDSLIVAAAHRCGSEFLLTEDLSHDTEIGSVKIISPFKVAADDVL